MIVDLSELDFADSSLMIDLAVLAQRLRARDRTLSLRDPKPHVRQLIELVGLHRLPSVSVIAPRAARAHVASRARAAAWPTITRLPSGSRTRATRSPHGWSAGSATIAVTPAARRRSTAASQSSA